MAEFPNWRIVAMGTILSGDENRTQTSMPWMELNSLYILSCTFFVKRKPMKSDLSFI
jgi:hypothetical protein